MNGTDIESLRGITPQDVERAVMEALMYQQRINNDNRSRYVIRPDVTMVDVTRMVVSSLLKLETVREVQS